MLPNQSMRLEAIKLHGQNRLQQAEAIYRKLLVESPQDTDVANLGCLLRNQGRSHEAFKIYLKWLPKFNQSTGLTLNAVNCAI